jgi:hypothetical protein
MNLEIEKKAKIKDFKKTKEKLVFKYGSYDNVTRIDYYLINEKKQEIRVSVVNYINDGKKNIEITHKQRMYQENLEVNKEYILFCNNKIAQILEFWNILGFSLLQSKIKKYLAFEDENFKIALVYFIKIKKQKENLKLPHCYLEVECLTCDQNNARKILDDFFTKMNLSEIEERRYVDMK